MRGEVGGGGEHRVVWSPPYHDYRLTTLSRFGSKFGLLYNISVIK